MSSSLKPLLILLCAAFYSSVVVSSSKSTFRMSTIAAEPAVLPYTTPDAAHVPALSPDETPLFPTPVSGSSPDSSLPVIPSSPSPPNPDSAGMPHPELSIAPSGMILESSAFGLNLSVLLSSAMLFLVACAFW